MSPRTSPRTDSRPPAHRVRLAAALAATGVVTTGCFAGSSDPGSGSSADGGGERISLSMLLPPRSGLSPFSDDAFKLSRWSTAETLVRLDADGVAEPMLATSWEQTAPRTWTFDLRPDVTFHDGTVMDADAVAGALAAATRAELVPRVLDGVELSVEVVDDDTVEVATAVPDPLLPQRLSSPQLSILAPRAYEGAVVDPVGTGSGPFELVAVEGGSAATLDRYDGYWGEPAEAAGIDVTFVPDGTARAAALRTGESDVVEAIPVGQAASVDDDLLHEVPMPRTNTLYLNNDRGPFADPAVRAAARAAIDRARLVADVYEGRADVAEGLLGPALPWAAPLRESADYLAALGEPTAPARVDGVEITLGTFTDRAELPEVAVLLEQALEDSGFVVTQDVREYQFIEADALDGAFDAFILSRATVLDTGDPVAYLQSDFGCEGSFNIAQVCDPAIDRAISAAAAAEAGEERQALTMDTEATILSSDVVVPLLHERVLQGEATGVSGVERDPRERELVDADSTRG